MTVAQIHAALAEQINAVRAHFDAVILPMWMAQGFNDARGLPVESLDVATGAPLPAERYRAMACARQLYVYAEAPGAAAGGHAERLFASLRRVFYNGMRGGWRYSVDADGLPLDQTQDLYTHAFIVFACAAYFRRSRDADARQLMLATAETIESRFKTADGLYHAALSPDWRQVLRGPAQNPMMHLTEAYLAAAQVAESALFVTRLRGLAQAMAQSFLSAPTHCILEAPQGASDNRIEPGHQFEWLSLTHEAAAVFDGLDLAASLPRAVHWTRNYGVAAGGVVAALDERGAVLDDTRRIWAQTEYLRALAVLGDLTALNQALADFRLRFLHAGGWYECLDGAGALMRTDMPSTSPYHLATCLAALQAIA